MDVVNEFHTFIRPQRNAKLGNRKDIPQQVFDESPAFLEVRQNCLKFLSHHGVTESNTLAIT